MKHPLRAILIFILGCSSVSVFSGQWSWKTFTSTLQILDMADDGSRLWCATDGGLLAFNQVQQSFETWTNTEGLASNEMTAVIRDRSGQLWLGFSNGLLQNYDQNADRWSIFEDFKNHPISCLRMQGDSLFVGLDIGVSLFLISRQEVKETYRRLGDMLQVEIPIRDLCIRNNQIWAATDMGVAYTNLQDNNLLDPKNWINPTDLPVKEITKIIQWENRMVLGSSKGVVIEDVDHWTQLSNGFPNVKVNDLAVYDGLLYAATSSGVFRWDGQSWSSAVQGSSACLSLAVSESRMWIGTENGLWILLAGVGTAERHVPDCPAESQFAGMAVDSNGELWCASSFYAGKGVYRFDGSHWTNYNLSDTPAIGSDDFGRVAVDHLNRKWFGSWGNGLVLMESDTVFDIFNVQNGKLSTSTDINPVYAAVSDVCVDQQGTVWILNYNSRTYRPLISVYDDTWTYYGSADGVTIGTLKTLAVDQDNRKWIGTLSDGILIVDDQKTPWDKTDDAETEWLTTSDGLSSNAITTLAVDHDGTVWIGTDDGLYYYSYGALSQINAYYQDAITALMVDGINNLWVGTNIGVGYVSTATWAVTHFTTENSPLVSNQITALTYNPQSGMVYIGTSKGLSCIETPFSQTVSQMKTLSTYPNPFIPDRHETLTIEGLSKGVSVSVFTMNGFIVRSYPLNNSYGRRIFWDGKNDNGETVAGGIYLIVARAENGRRAIGKVAVIR